MIPVWLLAALQSAGLVSVRQGPKIIDAARKVGEKMPRITPRLIELVGRIGNKKFNMLSPKDKVGALRAAYLKAELAHGTKHATGAAAKNFRTALDEKKPENIISAFVEDMFTGKDFPQIPPATGGLGHPSTSLRRRKIKKKDPILKFTETIKRWQDKSLSEEEK